MTPNTRTNRTIAALIFIVGLAAPVSAASIAYSSFLGGSVEDRANAIAVDSAGNAYLTGKTASTVFPGAASGFQPGNTGGAFDMFVTKITAAGALGFSTYYGGAGADIGLAIAVDAAGKIYVSGSTTGTLPAAVLIGGGGGTQAFIAAISATGGTLIYAKSIGGSGEENGTGIAVDSSGNAYVTGFTDSAAPDFVTTAGAAQATCSAGGATDLFLTKFTAAGVQAYSTCLGGTGIDLGNAIAIDSLGNAYVTGQTSANLPVFPTAPPASAAFKLAVSGSNDALIGKLDPTGANWLYVTYLGGSDQDMGTGITLGAMDLAYVTGYTFSADFPGNGFAPVGQTTIGTAPDAFVFKLKIGNGGGSNDGIYSTYLGASGDDRATAIAVDGGGNAYVSGITSSGDFPIVGPVSGGGTLIGNPEAFVTKLGPTGGVVGFSSYLGGSTMSAAQGVALDGSGNIYLAGWTDSSAATFPTASPFQGANAGAFDAFITKIAAPPPSVCRITSVNPQAGFMVGGTTVTLTGSGFSGFFTPSVTFGGVAATAFSANSAGTILTAVTPRHPLAGPVTPGTVPLEVRALAGSCTSVFHYAVTGTSCSETYFFPSPASGASGQFAYCLDAPGTVRIHVYNELGDLVAKVEDTRPAGPGFSQLNTGRLAPGVYLYRLVKDYGGGNSTRSSVKKFAVKR